LTENSHWLKLSVLVCVLAQACLVLAHATEQRFLDDSVLNKSRSGDLVNPTDQDSAIQNMHVLLESFQGSRRAIQLADRDQLAECARILALTLAELCLKHGEVPVLVGLAAERPNNSDEDEAKLMVSAFRILTETLSTLLEDRRVAAPLSDAVH